MLLPTDLLGDISRAHASHRRLQSQRRTRLDYSPAEAGVQARRVVVVGIEVAVLDMARAAAAAVAVLAVVALALRAEAGQNCICECMKLCARAKIPSVDGGGQCAGKCREKACTKSCEEACTLKGYPKLPNEGIPTCEVEPLTPDETRMLLH